MVIYDEDKRFWPTLHTNICVSKISCFCLVVTEALICACIYMRKTGVTVLIHYISLDSHAPT